MAIKKEISDQMEILSVMMDMEDYTGVLIVEDPMQQQNGEVAIEMFCSSRRDDNKEILELISIAQYQAESGACKPATAN